jgi:hypothetical protein
MAKGDYFAWLKYAARILFFGGVFGFFPQLPALASSSVTLAWNPSSDASVAGYNIYYGSASHDYTNEVPVGNVTSASISGLVAGSTYFFAATAYDASGQESAFSNEASYVIPTNSVISASVVNHPPTLNVLKSLKINENSGLQTINLTGISSGATNESQALTISAVSSNPTLIPNPVVNYVSPNVAGTLNFAPAANASGTATITVTVNDGGTSNNIVVRSFAVTVKSLNRPPTLATITNLFINENAGLQILNLTGITSGASNEIQTLTVTAVSSKPSLIPNPVVSYISPNATGTLAFMPVTNGNGTAKITVTVNDGQSRDETFKRTFKVTVEAVNQPPTLNPIDDLTLNENAGNQSVTLSGITSGAANEKQKLAVTATSDNPALIPNPVVSYTSAQSTGTLTFSPVANGNGTAVIAVTVNDGGKSNNIIVRNFAVTVLDASLEASAVTTSVQKAITANQEQEPAADLKSSNTVTVSFDTNDLAAAVQLATTAEPTTPESVAPGQEPEPAAVLGSPNYSNGQFTLTVTGTPETNYVVQASSNLADWVSIQTNASPFTFVDTNAGQFNQRFYRAIYLPED